MQTVLCLPPLLPASAGAEISKAEAELKGEIELQETVEEVATFLN